MSQMNMINSNLILRNLNEKNKIWRFKLPIHLCFDSKRNNRNSLIRKHFFSTWQIEHQHGDEARAQKIMCSVMGIK